MEQKTATYILAGLIIILLVLCGIFAVMDAKDSVPRLEQAESNYVAAMQNEATAIDAVWIKASYCRYADPQAFTQLSDYRNDFYNSAKKGDLKGTERAIQAFTEAATNATPIGDHREGWMMALKNLNNANTGTEFARDELVYMSKEILGNNYAPKADLTDYRCDNCSYQSPGFEARMLGHPPTGTT